MTASYVRNQMRRDPAFAVRTRVTARISQALKAAVAKKGVPDSWRSTSLLGCTLDEYVHYLEGLFEPGMTWENWGDDGWHVDHVRPLASFDLTDPDQQRQAFHYKNTRPIWAFENLSKGSLWNGQRHKYERD